NGLGDPVGPGELCGEWRAVRVDAHRARGRISVVRAREQHGDHGNETGPGGTDGVQTRWQSGDATDSRLHSRRAEAARANRQPGKGSAGPTRLQQVLLSEVSLP